MMAADECGDTEGVEGSRGRDGCCTHTSVYSAVDKLQAQAAVAVSAAATSTSTMAAAAVSVSAGAAAVVSVSAVTAAPVPVSTVFTSVSGAPEQWQHCVSVVGYPTISTCAAAMPQLTTTSAPTTISSMISSADDCTSVVPPLLCATMVTDAEQACAQLLPSETLSNHCSAGIPTNTGLTSGIGTGGCGNTGNMCNVCVKESHNDTIGGRMIRNGCNSPLNGGSCIAGLPPLSISSSLVLGCIPTPDRTPCSHKVFPLSNVTSGAQELASPGAKHGAGMYHKLSTSHLLKEHYKSPSSNEESTIRLPIVPELKTSPINNVCRPTSLPLQSTLANLLPKKTLQIPFSTTNGSSLQLSSNSLPVTSALLSPANSPVSSTYSVTQFPASSQKPTLTLSGAYTLFRVEGKVYRVDNSYLPKIEEHLKRKKLEVAAAKLSTDTQAHSDLNKLDTLHNHSLLPHTIQSTYSHINALNVDVLNNIKPKEGITVTGPLAIVVSASASSVHLPKSKDSTHPIESIKQVRLETELNTKDPVSSTEPAELIKQERLDTESNTKDPITETAVTLDNENLLSNGLLFSMDHFAHNSSHSQVTKSTVDGDAINSSTDIKLNLKQCVLNSNNRIPNYSETNRHVNRNTDSEYCLNFRSNSLSNVNTIKTIKSPATSSLECAIAHRNINGFTSQSNFMQLDVCEKKVGSNSFQLTRSYSDPTHFSSSSGKMDGLQMVGSSTVLSSSVLTGSMGQCGSDSGSSCSSGIGLSATDAGSSVSSGSTGCLTVNLMLSLPPSPPDLDSGEETQLSCQGYETASIHNTEPETEVEDDVDDEELSATSALNGEEQHYDEYEPITDDDVDIIELSDSDIDADFVVATFSVDSTESQQSSEFADQSCTESDFDDTELDVASYFIALKTTSTRAAFATSSEDDVDAVADRWKCLACNKGNNKRFFRYCEKCWEIRRGWLPDPPKKRRKRKPRRRPRKKRSSSNSFKELQTVCAQERKQSGLNCGSSSGKDDSVKYDSGGGKDAVSYGNGIGKEDGVNSGSGGGRENGVNYGSGSGKGYGINDDSGGGKDDGVNYSNGSGKDGINGGSGGGRDYGSDGDGGSTPKVTQTSGSNEYIESTYSGCMTDHPSTQTSSSIAASDLARCDTDIISTCITSSSLASSTLTFGVTSTSLGCDVDAAAMESNYVLDDDNNSWSDGNFNHRGQKRKNAFTPGTPQKKKSLRDPIVKYLNEASEILNGNKAVDKLDNSNPVKIISNAINQFLLSSGGREWMKTDTGRSWFSSEEVQSTMLKVMTQNNGGQSGQDSSLCIVCKDRRKDAAIIHGKISHQATCYKCAKTLLDRRQCCPVCRRKIHMITKHVIV